MVAHAMHARSCWERLGRRRLIVFLNSHSVATLPAKPVPIRPAGGGTRRCGAAAGGRRVRGAGPASFYETVPDVCQTWRAHQCVMSALTASPSATVTTHDLAWPRREPGQPPYVNVKVVLTHLSLQSSQGKPAFTPVMVKRTLSARPCMPTTHT